MYRVIFTTFSKTLFGYNFMKDKDVAFFFQDRVKFA
jgi:hypothetical protein